MMVERCDKWSGLDFADKVDRSARVCFGAGEEARCRGSGWREGLLWVDI